MSKKIICLLSLVLTLGLLSTGYSDVVYDFETGTQNWGGLKDGTAPTVSPEVHSAGGKQSLRVTIDEAAHGQQEGGWSSPRDFTVNQANLAAGGFTTLSFWYRIDNPNFNGGNFVCHWISSTESWSGGGWYGNGLWGVVIADGQWHQQTFDLSILGQAAGGWQGTWGDLAAWEFRNDLRYSIEIAVSPTDKTTGSNMYLDDVKLSGGTTPLPAGVVMIGDFEGGLDNWKAAWEGSPVLATATKGVTSGAGSLSLTTTGGYYCLQWNAPTVPKTLAGTKLQFDLTMIAAEWPVGLWTKVADKVALNSDGPSGWKEFTSATVVDKLTGATASADWGRWWDAAPDVQKTYTIDISNYDVTGATWFQINISVQGGNGTGHFYFDNVQLISPPPPSGKSTDTVIGNWEQSMDGWVAGGGADVVFNDHNGVTLGNYSLDVFVPTGGGWNQDVLQLDVNAVGLLDAFKANTRISVDITRLVADWPTDVIPQWNEIALIVDTGGDGWNSWVQLPVLAGWNQRDNGDQTTTATWDYGARLSDMNYLEGVTRMTLRFVTNVNSTYTGWLLFYLDNMKLSGGGVPLNPQPANSAVEVPITSKLSWTAGAFATKHHVYFGTDAAKVRNANKASDPNVVFSEQTGTTFDPNGLAFRTQYFWRVDEVNEANPDSPWNGPLWSFTSANFAVVDDFESYNDIDPPDPASHRIFEAWADGFGTTTNGALVGNAFPPYTEQTVVHGGRQAMPLFYDNTLTAVQSETQRVWTVPQNWTINNFNALTLYVHGSPSNVAGQMYVIVADAAGASAKVANPDSAVFTAEDWKEWTVSFDQLAGVNTAAVTKLVIGVANLAGQPKAGGVLAIDDIRVRRVASGANLLTNGGFEEGPSMPFNTWEPLTWNIYGAGTGEVVSQLTGAAVPEAPKEGTYCLHVVVPTAGANSWDVGLQHTGHTFEAGTKYTVSYFLKSKQGTAQIHIKPELGEDPYTGYGEQTVTITDQWAEYSVTTPVFASNVTPATLTLHIAFAACDFWVDGVRFYEGDYVAPPK